MPRSVRAVWVGDLHNIGQVVKMIRLTSIISTLLDGLQSHKSLINCLEQVTAVFFSPHSPVDLQAWHRIYIYFKETGLHLRLQRFVLSLIPTLDMPLKEHPPTLTATVGVRILDFSMCACRMVRIKSELFVLQM